MSNYKMKSLLKGLRYISHVFESEKEPEMKIGLPTDVKHLAHIGCDGPSATAPSWMNEFKARSGFEPYQHDGGGEDDSSVKCLSEGGRTRDLPKLPKSSNKSASGSPTKDRSDKTKRRTSGKGTSEGNSRSRRSTKEAAGEDEDSSWSRHSGLPKIPKKSRRKKSKDSTGGGSSRSSRRSDTSEHMSDCGSVRSVSHHGEHI